MFANSPANLARRAFPVLLVVVALATALMQLTVLARPSAQESNGLVGDFATTIPDDWVPKDVANSFALVGRWRLSFKEDGSYEAARVDVGTLVSGTYEVEGDAVTVTDESGLLSCASGAFNGVGDDPATGTYNWEIRSGTLTFTLVEDGCALRQTLFTAGEFAVFVACTTEAMTLGATADATPSSDEAEPAPDPAATPVDEGGASPLDILEIDATQQAEEGGEPDAAAVASAEEGIDALLGQLTACWSSGDPAKFLPLLSEEFRATFLTGTEEEQQTAIDQLRGAMQVSISWERAGELELDGDDRASAVVRTRALDEEEFVRFLFVLEDGEWRWDGSEA